VPSCLHIPLEPVRHGTYLITLLKRKHWSPTWRPLLFPFLEAYLLPHRGCRVLGLVPSVNEPFVRGVDVEILDPTNCGEITTSLLPYLHMLAEDGMYILVVWYVTRYWMFGPGCTATLGEQRAVTAHSYLLGLWYPG